MGICNITKDSFSDGGLNFKKKDALSRIKLMLKQGASIIDIGAESTRPGSDPISYNKEIKKISPILKCLPKNKFIISVDTNKIETQEFALKSGVHIINDIFGGPYKRKTNEEFSTPIKTGKASGTDMPPMLDKSGKMGAIDEVIKITGANGLGDMGKVMGELMPKLEGRADGKVASNMVKEKLNIV